MKRVVTVMLAMVMGAILVVGSTGCLSSKVATRKVKKTVPGMHTKEEKAVKNAKESLPGDKDKDKKIDKR